MKIETYTERMRGFIQSAQQRALAEGHQQFIPEHLLKELVEDGEGLAASLIDRAGGNAKQVLLAAQTTLDKLPKVSGGNGGIYMAQPLAKIFSRAEEIGKKAGDFVRHCRALPHRIGDGTADGEDIQGCRCHACCPERSRRKCPERPHGGFRLCRRRLRCAEEVCAGSDRACPRRQARPGDRARRGNPPRGAGAVAAHEEQSRADRRARRR